MTTKLIKLRNVHDVVLGGGSTLSKDRCEELNTDFVRNSQGPFEALTATLTRFEHVVHEPCVFLCMFLRANARWLLPTETHMKSKTSVRAGRDHAATADQGRAILKCRIFLLGVAPLPMDELAMMICEVQDHRSFLI